MITFLLGVSVAINVIFISISFALYKSHKIKKFLDNTIKQDEDVWDF